VNAQKRSVVVALLLVGVGMALVVGYARWKHNSLLQEASLLEKEGFTLDWDETWWNWIRPVSVKEASFSVAVLPNERAKIGEVEYTFEEANAYFVSIAERLKRFGVEEVQIIRDGKRAGPFDLTE
jgi:hypothetical protein